MFTTISMMSSLAQERATDNVTNKNSTTTLSQLLLSRTLTHHAQSIGKIIKYFCPLYCLVLLSLRFLPVHVQSLLQPQTAVVEILLIQHQASHQEALVHCQIYMRPIITCWCPLRNTASLTQIHDSMHLQQVQRYGWQDLHAATRYFGHIWDVKLHGLILMCHSY